MVTELRLAQHGMGMQEATIIQWHKQEGEPFAAGDLLVEVEAAKTTVEIEAEEAGTLIRIVAQPDEVVEVGAVLAELSLDSVPASAGTAAAAPAAVRANAPEPVGAVPEARPREQDVSVQVEPRARRLAEQSGVDLAAISATGPGGRITEADVQRHLEVQGEAKSSAGVPLKGLRGTIARKMLQSLQSTAQLTLVTEADVTDFEARRATLKREAPLSLTEMLVPALVAALRRHPQLNALLENDVLTRQPDVNIGVAVQTEAGLVVPVIHGADRLGLRALQARLRQLVEASRSGSADPGDMSGGTFTVTNLGAYGIDAFTPILHAPQVAILGVGRAVERYVRRDGGPEWRTFLTLSLTFDHRAVDGAPAAEFLRTLSEALAQPDTWLDA